MIQSTNVYQSVRFGAKLQKPVQVFHPHSPEAFELLVLGRFLKQYYIPAANKDGVLISKVQTAPDGSMTIEGELKKPGHIPFPNKVVVAPKGDPIHQELESLTNTALLGRDVVKLFPKNAQKHVQAILLNLSPEQQKSIIDNYLRTRYIGDRVNAMPYQSRRLIEQSASYAPTGLLSANEMIRRLTHTTENAVLGHIETIGHSTETSKQITSPTNNIFTQPIQIISHRRATPEETRDYLLQLKQAKDAFEKLRPGQKHLRRYSDLAVKATQIKQLQNDSELWRDTTGQFVVRTKQDNTLNTITQAPLSRGQKRGSHGASKKKAEALKVQRAKQLATAQQLAELSTIKTQNSNALITDTDDATALILQTWQKQADFLTSLPKYKQRRRQYRFLRDNVRSLRAVTGNSQIYEFFQNTNRNIHSIFKGIYAFCIPAAGVIHTPEFPLYSKMSETTQKGDRYPSESKTFSIHIQPNGTTNVNIESLGTHWYGVTENTGTATSDFGKIINSPLSVKRIWGTLAPNLLGLGSNYQAGFTLPTTGNSGFTITNGAPANNCRTGACPTGGVATLTLETAQNPKAGDKINVGNQQGALTRGTAAKIRTLYARAIEFTKIIQDKLTPKSLA